MLTRRELLGRSAAIAALAALPPFVATSAAAAGEPFRAYTPDSFFKSKVAGAPIDAARTTAFRSFMRSHPDQKGTTYPVIRGVGGNTWGTAYAMGTSADPVWKLTGSVPSEVSWLKTTGFHAPEYFGVMLTGTSDSPFVVIDRVSGQSIWAAKTKLAGSNLISVRAAGACDHASNGLDKRNPRSNSESNFRSRGAIPDAMVIRKDLVDWGIDHNSDLGHVLHMFLVETKTADGFCHPMVGTESGKNGFGAEGERIALRADLDLASRDLSPTGRVIASTLQNYGAYFGDNSGSTTALKAEQTSSTRDVWGSTLTVDTLRSLTWDDFVVIPKGWQ